MAIDTDKFGRVIAISARVKAWILRAPEHLKWLQEKFPWRIRFRSLTTRLFVFNLIGVTLLIIGVFYFNQTRQWQIEDATKNLRAQGEIIAAAIARNTNPNRANVNIDAEELLESDISGGRDLDNSDLPALEFPIKPQLIGPVFRQLIRPTNTRARVYNLDGTLILDSHTFLDGGLNSTKSMTSTSDETGVNFRARLQKLMSTILAWFRGNELPLYREIGQANGNAYHEVSLAINGTTTPLLMVNEKGQHIVSIGVPVRRTKTILGALQLTTRGGDIDKRLAAERWTLFLLATGAILATILSTLLLAGTIGRPMRRLSDAAKHVRRTIRARTEIPEMPDRLDEIGQLSAAFRDMTQALYRRIEASEKFAADVAHELKNPLTSVRSAAETLRFAKSDNDRQELIETIENDVKRLDRLITDIASSSRLDAELAMGDLKSLDISDMLSVIVDVFRDIHEDRNINIELDIADPQVSSDQFRILGHDSRLGQVLNNLIDNAVSFSPEGATVWVRARRLAEDIEIRIEDEGTGIPPKNIEKIFKRFYTDRPDPDAFGLNSGLGLSISRDIVIAHNGRIWAENRFADNAQPTKGASSSEVGDILGACFVICLPAELTGRANKQAL